MKQFLKDMVSNSDNVSSGRIAFMIIAPILLIFMIFCKYYQILDETTAHLIERMFYSICGFITVHKVSEQFGGNDDEPK